MAWHHTQPDTVIIDDIARAHRLAMELPNITDLVELKHVIDKIQHHLTVARGHTRFQLHEERKAPRRMEES